MIISERHKLAFVHIPKCGGTSIRRLLEPYDDWGERFDRSVHCQHSHSSIDKNHIPLRTLSEYFPEDYDRVLNYWSFSIVRNPYERFRSSLAQKLRAFSDLPLHRRSDQDLRRECAIVIDELRETYCTGKALPPHLIHFQPQIDFVECEGERVISDIFLLEDIEYIPIVISEKKGADLDLSGMTVGRENESKAYRSEAIKYLYNRLAMYQPSMEYLPLSIKHVVRRLVYAPQKSTYILALQGALTKRFIGEFYCRDISLWMEVSERNRRANR